MNIPFYGILYAFAILLLISCNPVKKVLNDPKKTQAVVDNYIKNASTETDTITSLKTGETVTNVIIGYDTTYVHDTIQKTIEKVVRKVVTNTINRTDTVERVIHDNKPLQACQKLLIDKDGDVTKYKAEARQAKDGEKIWRLRFFLLLSAIGVVSLVAVLLKLKR